jgi:hypothetical protein
MKKSIIYLSVITLSLSVFFSACKKDVQSGTNTDTTSQVTTQADDQSMVSEETDAVTNDANTTLESSSSISGREDGIQLICDATVVKDTTTDPKTITITYNGTNCAGNRSRTGVVVISIPAGTHWKNAGAVVTVDYQNLKITRLRDNKSITINGTHTITNVSGGLLINLPDYTSITHTITSNNMSITFDDGLTRNWQVARQRVFNYNNGVVITTTGTHTDGSNSGIETWGTTRFGNAFTNSILTPLVIRQDCSYRLTSGVYQHVSVLATTVVTFGLDSSGNPTSCPGSGTYYYKAVWTGINGKVKTVIAPY